MEKLLDSKYFGPIAATIAVLIIGTFFITLILLTPAPSLPTPTPTAPISPLPTPVSPLPTPTPTPVVVSPLPTGEVKPRAVGVQVEPTPTHFSSGVVEVYCTVPGVTGSPLVLKTTPGEITPTLRLEVKLQIRQNGVVKLEQSIPTYMTMQLTTLTTAPSQPCSDLFKRIEYNWRGFNSDLSGPVEEWTWLQWGPDPITATLVISDTGEPYNPDTLTWYHVQDSQVVTAQGYAYNRTFLWGEPTMIYLPLVLRNAP